uniref:Sacchrp_dh_NADP domain-containing protein n=1 Tax=Panagrellus redivivus TaxID=6233 RepID=A0A7E4WC28_PANRE
MSERYDIVLYGASGFTGAYVLEAIAKSADTNVRYAVAGRSESKLKATLKDVSTRVDKDLSKIPIIIADSGDESTLAAMARQAKVIINVVGPYRLYGEAVVKAAVENGASHVDISGEPAFLEKMQQKYGELAAQNKVYIVGACGWDSIPCDLGVNFLKQNFGGTLNYAETFVQLHTGES